MPFAAVLSCADSRVPVELVFDQSIGRLFVARVAGNLTTPEIFASLEYGAEALAVKAILVLAHTNCGAVQAAILGKEPGGQITALYPHIQPAIPLPPTTPNPDAVALVNAQNQAELLRDASPLLKGLVDDGDLKIVSGIYDRRNRRGEIRLVGLGLGSPPPGPNTRIIFETLSHLPRR